MYPNTAVFVMCGPNFLPGGSGPLFQMHGIMYSIKQQQIKNQNLTDFVRNHIMGSGWIFHQDNDLKINIKINTKMCH